MKHTLRSIVALAVLVCTPALVSADTVREWNAIATSVPVGSPFNQARVVAITQLAVFEAVNAIDPRYQPYLGTVVAPAGASVDAAVIAAAYRVLRTYALPAGHPMLDAARAASLAAIPDGTSKDGGVATGEAAAAAMLANRLNDGATPAEFYLPGSTDPNQWQLTAGCTASGGLFLNWRNLKTFGVANAVDFHAAPPPAATTPQYTRDFDEVKRMGSKTSAERPQHRTEVAQFYAATSPAYIFNMAARQVATAQGRSLADTARALALINMAISDAAVASFGTKYHYTTWRPETAIHMADIDDNPQTDADPTWQSLIAAPCFPSYTSNHASLSGGGAEVLRRLYGEGDHAITITNPAFPSLTYQYAEFKQILRDISDARVYGGIHYRFDQDEGERLGRAVATAVYKGNLRKLNDQE